MLAICIRTRAGDLRQREGTGDERVLIQHLSRTEAQTVAAAWAASQCQNTMARFTNTREAGMTAEQFQALWADRDDISYGQNGGFWVGRASVYRACVTGPEAARKADGDILRRSVPQAEDGAGTLHRTNLMSPLVEVALDGQTAKGMWYCPGVITALEADGKNHLQWNIQRLAADFVLEDEAWKIWHMQVLTDFVTPAGEDFDPALGAAIYPAGLGIDKTPTEPGELYAWYSQDRPARLTPRMPEPYETFADTFSY